MRNPGPVDLVRGVQRKVAAEVGPVQVGGQAVQSIRRERLTAFHHPVRGFLKLGKQHLRVHSAPDLINPVVQKVQTPLWILRAFQKVVREKSFVHGGGNLCHENTVVTVDVGLRAPREVRVHGVPQLVRQREYVVQAAVVVQKDVRVGPVGTPGIRPGAFTAILVHVDPPFAESTLQLLTVLLSEDAQRFQHRRPRLLVRNLPLQARHKRHVEIVRAHTLQLQHAFSQRDGPVQRFKLTANGGDQVVVDLVRNVVGIQGHAEGGIVAACARVEDVLLDAAVQHRRECVGPLAVLAVQGAKGVATDATIRRLLQKGVAALGHLDFVALLVSNGGEFQVGVVEHVEDVVRGARHLRGPGQKLFLFPREHVLAGAKQVLQEVAVHTKLRVFLDPLPQLLFGNFENFGVDESRGLLHTSGKAGGPIAQSLVPLVRRVLVAAHGRVHKQALKAFLQSVP